MYFVECKPGFNQGGQTLCKTSTRHVFRLFNQVLIPANWYTKGILWHSIWTISPQGYRQLHMTLLSSDAWPWPLGLWSKESISHHIQCVKKTFVYLSLSLSISLSLSYFFWRKKDLYTFPVTFPFKESYSSLCCKVSPLNGFLEWT